MSKDLLLNSAYSADHYGKELKVTMTDLAALIEQCSDTIFKVSFKKKVDPQDVVEKLQSGNLSDQKEMKVLSKDIVDGKQCEITGHLVSNEHLMGRSLMIDLNAPKGKGFRYVDHRTIQYIIFKNVKYTLGKRDAGIEDLPVKREKDEAHFDGTKLGLDNWFSSIQYYKVQNIIDNDNCMVRSSTAKTDLKLSRDIMEYEMFSGMVSDKEEKITRTQMAEKLIEAKDTVVTVKYQKKVDDKHVMEILATINADD